jgi:hypothetical protein
MKKFEYYIDETHPDNLCIYDISDDTHEIYKLGSPIYRKCLGHPSHYIGGWFGANVQCFENPREITKAQFDALINLSKLK